VTATNGGAPQQALLDFQSAIENIAQQVTPAIVHVQAEVRNSPDQGGGNGAPENIFPFGPDVPGPRTQPRSGVQLGSGIIISPDGVIVTNRHVIEGASRVTVALPDHRIFRGVAYSDPNIDLAVVKVDAHNLPYAQLADTSHLRIGQWAIAIGYPFEVGQTVSLGIISALGRSAEIEGKYYPNLIQTDASINPGNSGGALVDISGKVIGVNTAIQGPQNVGIGFAIPATTVSEIWEQLANPPHKITKYPPGWIRGKLGVQVSTVTPDLVKVLGADEGALVKEVQADSPASRAGIEAGDVITKVNDTPIRDANELVDTISDVGPNQHVILTLVRDKKVMTRTLITGSFQETTTISSTAPNRHLGLSVTTLTADLRPQLKVPDTIRDGAAVTAVRAGSPADDAGFQQGDVIVRVDDNPIHSAEDYSAAVTAAKPGDTLGIKIYRGQNALYLTLSIPEDTK
jgi:serine protease Do